MASSSSNSTSERGAALRNRVVRVPWNAWGDDYANSTEYIVGTVWSRFDPSTKEYVYTIHFDKAARTDPINLSVAQINGEEPYGFSPEGSVVQLLPKPPRQRPEREDTRKDRGATSMRDKLKEKRVRPDRTAQAKKARQRVASRQAYERRCQHVRQRHTNAQPINCGGGDGRDCPSHMRCDHPLCPQRFDASFSEDAEKCELRFHASTNVVFSMPHAD